MVIVALVLSLLALPAFGVRGEGISLSSQPFNPLDHHQAGLIEVEAGTGGREIENEEECDKELCSLEKKLTETCQRRNRWKSQWECSTEAKDTIEHATKGYYWQERLASKVLKQGKTPVFWAGFWPGGKKGIDTRQALADFISSVNGFQLADTEWGQAAESDGANNLEACTWDRKKNWWNVASISMAQGMALHKVPNIIIALHKTLKGDYSFYKTILYQAELPNMGFELGKKSSWNPQFEVHSIAVEGAPPDESGCALASVVKHQLELHANRSVTVRCRTCTTLQSCGDQQQVKNNEMEGKCIKGDCRNSQGTKVWADGDKYVGTWKKGKPNGQGAYIFANGEKYQGTWKKDKKDGKGTYTYANGEKYRGPWKNDKKSGQGTYTYPNGDVYDVRYKEDRLEEEKEKP